MSAGSGRMLAAAFLATGLLASVHAEVTLAPLFSDGMVLQRDKAVPIWGTASPGEEVVVTFQGQTRKTTATQDGHWSVELAALKTSTTEETLSVNDRKVSRVLVGDVWLCSGQSNMELPVAETQNAEQEIAGANLPLIREFRVRKTVSETPSRTVKGEWTTATPATVANFSSVGFYFAREVSNAMKVPVGIINSSWGATQIEAWMSREAVAQGPFEQSVAAVWQKRLAAYPSDLETYRAAKAQWDAEAALAKKENRSHKTPPPRAPEGPGTKWTPHGLFNAMIHPLLPYSISGILWYQGESNANAGRAAEYGILFKDMIGQWRRDFKQGDLPFYFVQLANCRRRHDPSSQRWAFLREKQLEALDLPNTGCVVTIDIGDPARIHPLNKQDVARRLARLAYDGLRGGQDASGPIFKEAKAENGSMSVRFSHSEGLRLQDPRPGDFSLAGANKIFYPAEAQIDGDTLKVSSTRVAQPVYVRYAWDNSPNAVLFNKAGLPASPFRSDNFPPPAGAVAEER